LLNAEYHLSEKETDKATECYEAIIRSACEHRFIHEEALACESTGYFFAEQEAKERSQGMLRQAYEAFHEVGCNEEGE
jgi:hypothetical protein